MVLKVWISLILLLCSSSAVLANTDLDGNRLDRIIVAVEEDIITENELDERIRQLRFQMGDKAPSPTKLEPQVLEVLILERIQLEQARKLGIRITDADLNSTMERIAKDNGLSLEQYRARLIREGFDYVNFREQIRNEMTIAQLRKRQVNNQIRVSDREVDDLLSSQAGQLDKDVEYHLLHLLVNTPEAATPDAILAAENEINQLRQRVVDGEDFASLAIQYSDGQYALKGGDLGWRYSAQLPTTFSRVVTLLQPGEVSEPLRSPSGFHLLKLEEKRGGQKSIVRQTLTRHILIKPDALISDNEAQVRVNSLRNRILNGESFEELARANSQDPGSAIDGGSLGWVNPGEMVKVFEDTMNDTAEGEVSTAFRSQFGWHILQVLDRRDHDNTRERLRNQARQFIFERKVNEETELWSRRLRDEAYVQVLAEEYR